MYKKVLYGKEAREKVLSGLNKIADAVAATLGPLGRNVLISQSMVVDYGVHSLPIHVTKDGYTCTKAFDIDDPFEKPGVLLAKECAQKTVDMAGDGTSTSIVLMRAIVAEGIRQIDAGANPMQLKKDIDDAVKSVIEELNKHAIKIADDNDKIFQIATISANNDIEIGRLIADAFKVIGNEGIIDLEASKSVDTEIKLSEGYRFENGWLKDVFLNKREKMMCEFDNPFILLYEKSITSHVQVERALTLAIEAGRPIVIICEDAREEGLGYLGLNAYHGKIKCCVVKSPSYGDMRQEDMEDMAILTGGTYISDSKGIGIKEIELENFGQAKKVLITKEETTIIGGMSDKNALRNLLNELRMNLAQAKNENEKAPIEKRIAKLTSGVAVIQVGAATETEMKEKLDRFDDAVRATKAAISEGYIHGAGSFFLRLYSKNGNIVESILSAPMRQICSNAGVEADSKIIEILNNADWNTGYNAKADRIEDLVKSGVIDPVKVLRCSLQNAASSAGMILTSEVLIADTL